MFNNLLLFQATPYTDDGPLGDMAIGVFAEHMTNLTESVRLMFRAPASTLTVTGVEVVSVLTATRARIPLDKPQTVKPGEQLTLAMNPRALEWSRGTTG